jgi:O-antigen/teichoic acid export membrane protein
MANRRAAFRQAASGSPARGAAWTAAAAVVANALLLILSLLLVRVLGAVGFGHFGLIHATVLLFSVLTSSALGAMVSSYVARYRPSSPVRAARAAAMGTIAAAVVGFAAFAVIGFAPASLLSFFFHDSAVFLPLRASALLVLLNGIFSVQSGLLLGLSRYDRGAQLQVTRALLFLVLGGLGGLEAGVLGAIGGMAFGSIIAVALAQRQVIFACREQDIPLWAAPRREDLRMLWEFSLPAVFSASLVIPLQWLLTTRLAAADQGYVQVGLYYAVTQWRSGIAMAPSALAQFALPHLSGLLGRGDRASWRDSVLLQIGISAVLGLALAIPLLLMTPWLATLYGRTYTGLELPLALSLLAGVLVGVNNVIGAVVASSRRLWSGFAMNLLWSLMVVVPLWSGWFPLTAVGLISSLLVAYCAHTVVQTLFVSRLMPAAQGRLALVTR